MTSTGLNTTNGFAAEMDAVDSLAKYRERFHFPKLADGSDCVYLCGHSLGLQPKTVRESVEQELKDWELLGVEGHFQGKVPWYSYHETLRDAGARLVGGLPHEVVFMNSLTVNLHLMLTTFYRPTADRFGILVDEPLFPSDRYALSCQASAVTIPRGARSFWTLRQKERPWPTITGVCDDFHRKHRQ